MRSIKKLVVKGGNQVLENEPQSSPQTSSKGSQKRKNSEKEITCKIRLLDDAQIPLELSVRVRGFLISYGLEIGTGETHFHLCVRCHW